MQPRSPLSIVTALVDKISKWQFGHYKWFHHLCLTLSAAAVFPWLVLRIPPWFFCLVHFSLFWLWTLSPVAFVERRRKEGFIDTFQHFLFPFPSKYSLHASCTFAFGFILAHECLSFIIEQYLFWWSGVCHMFCWTLLWICHLYVYFLLLFCLCKFDKVGT